MCCAGVLLMGVAPRIPGENAKGKMLAQIYEYGMGSASIKALYCNEKLASASDGTFEIHIKKAGTYRLIGWVQALDSAYKAYLKCNDVTIFGPFINSGFDLEKKLSAGDVISIPSQYMDYYSTASATLIILTT